MNDTRHARRLVLPILVAALFARLAGAQSFPQSTPAALFVPSGTRVPLSEFLDKPATGVVTMHVKPEILSWIKSNTAANDYSNVKVAIFLTSNGTQITTTVGVAVVVSGGVPTGEVTLTSQGANLTGYCVVVSPLITQDARMVQGSMSAIVTHWDFSLNGGRGGQHVGSFGAVSTLGYDGSLASPYFPATNSVLGNADPNYKDSTYPDMGPYVYNTSTTGYALFDDGSGVDLSLPLYSSYFFPPHNVPIAQVRVPDYERYVAENWSAAAATALRAIALSDQVRQATGYPIAHRNYLGNLQALIDSLPGGDATRPAEPVFQYVHGYVVTPPDDTVYPGTTLPVPGNEQSLASFLLPPDWNDSPSNAYKVLFYGFYDLNESMFRRGPIGLSMAQTIAELHAAPSGARQVVGILWNGGGGYGTSNWQDSIYTNVAQLISDAQQTLKIDPDAIVFSGVSRGGTTALELAANPLNKPYTAQYAYARAPGVLLGSQLDTYTTPSHWLALSGMAGATGYADSWKSTWVDHNYNHEHVADRTGRQLALYNLAGANTPAGANYYSSLDGTRLRDALLAQAHKTTAPPLKGVVLSVGTNDFVTPFRHVATYINDVLATDIPMRAFVYYRFGHVVAPAVPPASQPDDADLLNRIFDSAAPLAQGIEYFKRSDTDNELALPISPDAPGSHLPIVFELPMQTGIAQPHTWSFVGAPGAGVEVRVRPMTTTWSPCVGNIPNNYAAGEVSAWTGSLSSASTFGVATVDPTSILQSIRTQLGLPTGDRYWLFSVRYTVGGTTTVYGGDWLAARTLIAPPIPIAWPDSCFGLAVGLFEAETLGFSLDGRTGGLASDQEYP